MIDVRQRGFNIARFTLDRVPCVAYRTMTRPACGRSYRSSYASSQGRRRKAPPDCARMRQLQETEGEGKKHYHRVENRTTDTHRSATEASLAISVKDEVENQNVATQTGPSGQEHTNSNPRSIKEKRWTTLVMLRLQWKRSSIYPETAATQERRTEMNYRTMPLHMHQYQSSQDCSAMARASSYMWGTAPIYRSSRISEDW
jgi:hypothetical protein